MDTTIAAKIIMLPSSAVHIVLANHESLFATPENIKELLYNTVSFLSDTYQNFESSTSIFFENIMDDCSMNDLPCLTLCTVYKDYHSDILFPVVYHFLKNESVEQKKTPIILKNYIRRNDMQDPTLVFPHIYMAVVEQLYANMSLVVSSNWMPERIEAIIAEIMKTADYHFKRSKILHEQYKPTKEHHPSPPLKETRKKDKEAEKERKPRKKSTSKTKNSEPSYTDVQLLLKKRYPFSDNVRPFIRTIEEARYYVNHGYKEVSWDGQAALIIDVNLDYFVCSKGMTNREIILSGNSPVVQNDESDVYDIHHVGQQVNSPFVVIPSKEHNSKEFYSVFHASSSNDSNLHSNSFKVAKMVFWKNYVQQYDKYDGFDGIPSVQNK